VADLAGLRLDGAGRESRLTDHSSSPVL